jgi:putative ABC transport system permease protein
MKEIDVQKQPRLSPARIFQIAVTGVKYRLFRAVVTVAVIVVAMAFLMNILTESLIKRAVADSVREQIQERHRVDRWIARLSVPQSAAEILEQLADAAPEDAYPGEVAALTGQSLESIAQWRPAAREAVVYLRFFEQLDFGRLRVLVGPVQGTQVFDRLQDEAAWHQFQTQLAAMRTVRFPGELREFQDFILRWPALSAFADEVRSGQEQAVAQVREWLGERSVAEALRNADGEFGEQLRNIGFAFPEAGAAELAAEVRLLEHIARVDATINNPGVRQSVAAIRDVLPGDVTMSMIWRMVRNVERAEWFIGQMQENGLDTGELTPAALAELADQRAHDRLVVIAEQQTMEADGGLMGIGTRMTWLALVSMLVCAVGIANAMLMSVTERFREIATLKCLGALDAFIMSVFLIEAGLLGLVGGLGGALAGFVLATARMGLTFQRLLWPAFPFQDVLVAGLISIGVGMLLAAVSAVYPSFRAARLAPMEAMRIE